MNIGESIYRNVYYNIHIRHVYSFAKRLFSRSWTWIRYGRKHDAELDPFRIVWIDPRRIKFRQLPHESTKEIPYSVCAVVGGDWDNHVQPVREWDVYQSFYDRYKKNTPWEKTEFYDRVTEAIEKGKSMFGCTTENQFMTRCDKVDQLYNQIKENGYKTQREIINDDYSHPLDKHWARYCPELHEVTINIGRNGKLIFQEGRHRFVIAKLLELNEIPVRINVRHDTWQSNRDAAANGTHSDLNDLSHPDIEYL